MWLRSMDQSSLNMKKCLPFTRKGWKSVKETLRLKSKEKKPPNNKIKNLNWLLSQRKINCKGNKESLKLKRTNSNRKSVFWKNLWTKKTKSSYQKTSNSYWWNPSSKLRSNNFSCLKPERSMKVLRFKTKRKHWLRSSLESWGKSKRFGKEKSKFWEAKYVKLRKEWVKKWRIWKRILVSRKGRINKMKRLLRMKGK
jgi:hypothetical protein